MAKKKAKKEEDEVDESEVLEEEPVESTISNEDESDFNLDRENKYLVAGFKVSRFYEENLDNKKLEKAFNDYKKGD